MPLNTLYSAVGKNTEITMNAKMWKAKTAKWSVCKHKARMGLWGEREHLKVSVCFPFGWGRTVQWTQTDVCS